MDFVRVDDINFQFILSDCVIYCNNIIIFSMYRSVECWSVFLKTFCDLQDCERLEM